MSLWLLDWFSTCYVIYVAIIFVSPICCWGLTKNSLGISVYKVVSCYSVI